MKLTKNADVIGKLRAIVQKEAQAQTDISGKPGVDTKFTSVSDSTETTDKNAVGADKLNDKQKYKQEGAKDPSEPAKTAGELDKEASYRLGAKFAETLVKRAHEYRVKTAAEEQANLLKEAGRRDFEALIQQASLDLKQAQEKQAAETKQAEDFGAFMFDQMLKQAELEEAKQQITGLRNKLAEYEAFEKEAQARFEMTQRQNDMAKVAELVVERLKNELAPKQ